MPPVDQNSPEYLATDRGNADYCNGRPEVCPDEYAGKKSTKEAYHGGYDMARDYHLNRGRT